MWQQSVFIVPKALWRDLNVELTTPGNFRKGYLLVVVDVLVIVVVVVVVVLVCVATFVRCGARRSSRFPRRVGSASLTRTSSIAGARK